MKDVARQIKDNCYRIETFIVKGLFRFVLRLGLMPKEELGDESPEEKAINEIWKAHEEWKSAINDFDYVSGKELIDYSIYRIETNQKRFMYLLKQAKDQNIIVPDIEKAKVLKTSKELKKESVNSGNK